MILITGATGTVGTALIGELARGPRVRALVRDEAGAKRVERAGAEPAIGNFDDEQSLQAALDAIDTVFLLSPPGDDDMVRAQLRVVDHAVRAGVRRIVKLSSIGADEPTGARIIRAHRTIERHIEASGLTWTHLRPHWFMQNELTQAASIGNEGVFYAPDVTRIALIDARDVAAAAARVLTSGGHDGRSYVLTGPEPLSYAELAETFTAVLGRDVQWHEVTLAEPRASMVAAGLPVDLAAGFTEIMDRYREGGVTARVSPDTEALLGRARSFAEFVHDHREVFAAPHRAAA